MADFEDKKTELIPSSAVPAAADDNLADSFQPTAAMSNVLVASASTDMPTTSAALSDSGKTSDVALQSDADKRAKTPNFQDCIKSAYDKLFPTMDEVKLIIKVQKKETEEQSSLPKIITLPISIRKENIAFNKAISVGEGQFEIQFCGYDSKQRLKFDKIEFLVFKDNKIDLYYYAPSKIYSEKEFRERFSKAYENRKYIGMWWFPKFEEQKKIGKSKKEHDNSPFTFTVDIEKNKASRPVDEKVKKEIAERIKNNWVVFSDDSWKFPEAFALQSNNDTTSVDALGRTLSACIWLAIMHDTNSAGKQNDKVFFRETLPSAEAYVPKRRIDLRPFELKTKFENDEKHKLYYTTSALNSLAVALNSGDHVILTGPPGSGKTELATQLPKKLNPSQPFLLCTASPDWTTNELIGHYMPTTRQDDKTVLEFEPGFFIQAISDGKWLIIDELNRADIDSCMGPLFSVLSGHEVILPYKTLERYPDELETEQEDKRENASEGTDTTEQNVSRSTKAENPAENESRENKTSSENNSGKNLAQDGKTAEKNALDDADTTELNQDGKTEEKGKTSPQGAIPDPESQDGVSGSARHVGICLEKNFKRLKEDLQKDVFWYMVPEDFRIICTMNDSDAGMLNQLSYALQRRFSVIRVEAPEADKTGKCIEDKCKEVLSNYLEAPRFFPGLSLPADMSSTYKKKKNSIIEKYIKEIASYFLKLFANDKDKDLMQLRVVGFGQVRDIITMVIEGLSYPPGYEHKTDGGDEEKENIKHLVLTLLANGVVMKVFPQLPAFICNRDEEEIQESFLPALICIAKVFVNKKYYLNTVDNTNVLVIGKAKPEQDLLKDYLEKELRLLFRNQHVPWKQYWEYAKVFAESETIDKKTQKEHCKDLRATIEKEVQPVVKDNDFLSQKLNDLVDKLKPRDESKMPQASSNSSDAVKPDVEG